MKIFVITECLLSNVVVHVVLVFNSQSQNKSILVYVLSLIQKSINRYNVLVYLTYKLESEFELQLVWFL